MRSYSYVKLLLWKITVKEHYSSGKLCTLFVNYSPGKLRTLKENDSYVK